MIQSSIVIVRIVDEQKPIGLGKIRFETVKEPLGTNQPATPQGEEDVREIKIQFQVFGAEMRYESMSHQTTGARHNW
jgi:hypothetical protein